MGNKVIEEVKNKVIIDIEDFKEIFNSRKVITVEEYNFYIKTKSGKSREK